MKDKFICCLSILFFVCFVNVAEASFLIKKPAAACESATASKLTQIKNITALENAAHLNFFQKARMLWPGRDRRGYGMRQRSENCELSVLSFCLGLGAYLVASLGALAAIASGGLSVFLLVLSGVMALGAIVIGIIALADSQRLKGLAIAGICLGLYFVALVFEVYLILTFF